MSNKLYRHKKTGNIYEVLSTRAKREDDWSTAVAYRKYPCDDPGEIIFRDHDEFFDGRFEPFGESIDFFGGFDPVRDIAEFHEKFDIAYHGKPRALPRDLSRFRNGFKEEELAEYMAAQAAAYNETTRPPSTRDKANYTYHLEQALDGLVDLVYVALGTAYLHGFDFREAWRRVHKANMAKVRASSAADSKRGSAFDVVKPKGWEPPSHSDLVEDNDILEDHFDRA